MHIAVIAFLPKQFPTHARYSTTYRAHIQIPNGPPRHESPHFHSSEQRVQRPTDVRPLTAPTSSCTTTLRDSMAPVPPTAPSAWDVGGPPACSDVLSPCPAGPAHLIMLATQCTRIRAWEPHASSYRCSPGSSTHAAYVYLICIGLYTDIRVRLPLYSVEPAQGLAGGYAATETPNNTQLPSYCSRRRVSC